MKKTVLTIGMLALIPVGAFAQKANVRDARAYLRDDNYKKAITSIDAAVASEETKNNADAWFVRGLAYLKQAQDTVAKVPNAADEASRSFLKTLELKPDYDPADINQPLYVLAYINFRQGSEYFNSKDYGASYQKFMNALNIYNVNGGKRFVTNPAFTELAGLAKSNAAYAAMNNKDDENALRLLRESKTAQGKPDANVYGYIIDILNKQQKYDEMLAEIQEAKKLFPENKDFTNRELNYYINTGKMDQLLPKLEAAAAADPSNSELLFNLANSYEKVSFPKDANNKILARPANAQEIFIKAEDSYRKALSIQPENPDYNYNFGVLYYDVAVDLNGQMNEIKGMSAAETKKYNDLMAKRNAAFAQAQPYFEKAYTVLDTKKSSLKDEERSTYINSMNGLYEIYSRQDNKVKVDELKKKIAEMN